MPCLDINTMQTITFVLCDNGDQMTAVFNRKSCTCTLVERMDVIIFKFYVLDFKIFKTKKWNFSNTITQDFSKNSSLKVEIKAIYNWLTWFGLSSDMGNDYTGLCWTLYFIKDLFLDGLTLEPWRIREWPHAFMSKSKHLASFI